MVSLYTMTGCTVCGNKNDRFQDFLEDQQLFTC